MFDCYRFTNRVSDYVEGSLTPSEKVLFESHLKTCPKCQQRVEGVRGVRQALSSLPRRTTSPTFEAVLHANLRRVQRMDRQGFGLPRLVPAWQLPAFVIAAVFFMSLGILLDRAFLNPAQQNTRTNIPASILSHIPSGQYQEAEAQKVRLRNYVIEHYSQDTYVSSRTGTADSRDYLTRASGGDIRTTSSASSRTVSHRTSSTVYF